jgi:hypothetical protein
MKKLVTKHKHLIKRLSVVLMKNAMKQLHIPTQDMDSHGELLKTYNSGSREIKGKTKS